MYIPTYILTICFYMSNLKLDHYLYFDILACRPSAGNLGASGARTFVAPAAGPSGQHAGRGARARAAVWETV